MFRKKGVPTMKANTTISLKLLLDIAWHNLFSKKLRTTLTISGVVIGISAIFFLLSFGIGLRNVISEQVIGSASIKSIDITTNNSEILKLNDETGNTISNYPNVEKLSKTYSYPAAITDQELVFDAVVFGIDENYYDMKEESLIFGRRIYDEDKYSALVNMATLNGLGIDASVALDKEISLNVLLEEDERLIEISDEFRIVGVFDSHEGSEVYISNAVFESNQVRNYTTLIALTDHVDNVPLLREQIESQGFQTSSPADTLDQVNLVFRYFTIILVGFGAVGMSVAVLGMFNTLTISLIERTKEIGLMMALGARGKDMRRLFIVEAMLLSILGAVIGIFVAILFGVFINIVLNSIASNRGVTDSFSLFSTPAWLVLLTIASTTLIGYLVVLFPARRAQKIDPIDTLRRE